MLRVLYSQPLGRSIAMISQLGKLGPHENLENMHSNIDYTER